MAAYVIDPGELTERVTLQSRSVAKDAYGQDTITWTDVATVWARVCAPSAGANSSPPPRFSRSRA
jgi:head-tail adaptor